MRNLLSISRRRWLTEYKAHMAAVIIAAAVVLAWLLYWGYMEYMGASMSGRVVESDFPADFAAVAPYGTNYYVSDIYAQTLQVYHALDMETPLGVRPVAAIDITGSDAPLPSPQPGEVWLPESLRGVGQIDVGSPFQLGYIQDLRYRVWEGAVAGYYDEYDYYPAVVINAQWLNAAGAMTDAQEVSLYRRSANYHRYSLRWTEGISILTAATVAEQAKRVVMVAFSSGAQGVGLLFLFLILGVGTFSLLSYLDTRRELALLKSMGLRPNEMGALFVIEGIISAALGIGLALTITLSVDRWTDLPITLTAGLIGKAILLSLLAFAAATAIPYLLTQRAGVNELLLNRPVPLFRRSITQMARRYPALEPLLTAGYQLVKLPVVDGEFLGICFRQAGQHVKAGETVAWESAGWGVIEREYLAPCDGDVVRADLTQGLIIIKPTH